MGVFGSMAQYMAWLRSWAATLVFAPDGPLLSLAVVVQNGRVRLAMGKRSQGSFTGGAAAMFSSLTYNNRDISTFCSYLFEQDNIYIPQLYIHKTFASWIHILFSSQFNMKVSQQRTRYLNFMLHNVMQIPNTNKVPTHQSYSKNRSK